MEYIRERFERFTPSRWSKKPNHSPPDAPPALPVVRPRSLTATTPNATAFGASSFFQKLPIEIRRRILIEAFGESTLHLDLCLEHPPKKRSQGGNSHAKRHANTQLFRPSFRDASQRREWTWWSCVCHRSAASQTLHQYSPGLEPPGYEPALDRCRDATWPHVSCDCYPGQVPDKCFVGSMGWLLVCRQAYTEGVDVLYSTNRFHIAYAELAIYLPQLLLPRRLAAIKEIELSWDPEGDSSSALHTAIPGGKISGVNGRLSILARLPEILPNLCYLYLSLNLSSKAVLPELNPSVAIYGPEMYETSESILLFVDGIVMQMSQLQHCRVALPSSWYGTRKVTEKGQGIVWRVTELVEPDALWRELTVTNTDSQVTAQRPAVGGYWIVHGHRDMPPPPLSEV